MRASEDAARQNAFDNGWSGNIQPAEIRVRKMKSKLVILVAEDDPNDILLFQRAVQKAGLATSLQIARNGEDAISYLKGDDVYADRSQHPLPRLIFTDLKMPRVNGFELLEWLKKHEVCRRVPMIVLSSSNDPKDVQKAYELGANCYLLKPRTFDELSALIRESLEFWAKCELPEMPANC